MWDFSLSNAIGLMVKTLPYLLLRMAIYFGITVAFILVTGTGMGLGWGVGSIWGDDGRAAGVFYGGFGGLALVGGAIYLAREYILYQVKAGHIAVLLELMDGGDIPDGKNQVTYGASVVKERFVQSSVLFGIDQLVKGVLKAITGLISGIASFIPIPGIQNVVGIIKAFLKIAVGFADEIILAYAIKTKSDNPWDAAKTALVYYGQNHKTLLKNAAWLAFLMYVLSFVVFLIMLAPAAAIVWLLPGAWSAGGFIFALVFAWAFKAALIEPLAITCLMQVYFKAIEGQEPDPEWEGRLDGLSRKFSKLKSKATSWVGGGKPAEQPVGT